MTPRDLTPVELLSLTLDALVVRVLEDVTTKEAAALDIATAAGFRAGQLVEQGASMATAKAYAALAITEFHRKLEAAHERGGSVLN